MRKYGKANKNDNKCIFILILALSLTSAMVVKSVDATNFQPGNSQDITVKIKNTLGSDAKMFL